jgi:hypothetical protein
MPDYSKTIIYKLCCKDTSINDIYIGSTCNFRARKAEHKYRLNKNNNRKVYQFIRDNGGWDNWDMVMIQQESVENKLQKEKLEREYIDELKPTLNSSIPTRTRLERDRENKDYLNKKYDCECGGKYTTIHKSRHIKSKKHQDYINSK